MRPFQRLAIDNKQRVIKSASVTARSIGLILILGAFQVYGAEPTERDKTALIEFDFDSPPKTIHPITPVLSFGTKFELEYELQHNFDLTSSVDDNLETLQPEASIAFSYTPLDWASAFLEINLSHEFSINHPGNLRYQETKLEVDRAYVTLKDLLGKFTLQVGRQRYKDPREWWYDENLDAIRLLYNYHNFGVELSVSREELIGNDLLNRDNQKKINNYFAVGHYYFDRDIQVNAYLLFQDDHSPKRKKQLYLGIQSVGKITPQLDYWIDTAVLVGKNQSRDLRAFGFDLGVTYALKSRFKPSLTLGVAFGSGDGNTQDNTDKVFRQTGLEDNNGKFSGVTRFKYYGELFDPELSNLWILTADIGFRPSKKSSVDFSYHYYRQHKHDDRIHADVSIEPTGKHKEMGHELDIVIGFREVKNLKIELVGGVFFPGKAFPDKSGKAVFGKFQLSYRY